MDKKIIAALSNLSASLQQISDALESKTEDVVSAATTALKNSDFSKRLIQISNSIEKLQKSNDKIINQQNTLLKIQKQKSVERSEVKNVNQLKNETILETARQKNQVKLNSSVISSIKDFFTQKNFVSSFGESVSSKIKAPSSGIVPVTPKDNIPFFTKVFNKFEKLLETIIKSIAPREKKTILQTIKERLSKHITNPFYSINRENKIINSPGEEKTIVKTAKEKKEESKNEIKSKKLKNETILETGKEKKESKLGLFDKFDPKKLKDGASVLVLIAAGVLAIGLALKTVGRIDYGSVIVLALALPLIALAFSKISEIGLSVREIPNLVLLTLGIATAITLSSLILRGIQTVSIGQGLTAILISGVFGVLSFGFSKIVQGLKGVNLLTAFVTSALIPIVFLALSIAITASSRVLNHIVPISINQAFTAILIAGAFTVLSYGIGKILHGFRGISPTAAIAAAFLMPILFLSLSASIAISSRILGHVTPISITQGLVSILIAGVFTALSYGIGKILHGFRGINPAVALAAAFMMPILLVALSKAIAMSSLYLKGVVPIGFYQALTSILISAMFVVLSYGIGKILQAFRGINPVAAIAAAFLMPILLVALSKSIAISSGYLKGVSPISFSQALTSIFIAGVFVVLSYSISHIMKGVKGVSLKDVLVGTIVVLALTVAIAAASFLISKIPILNLNQLISFTLTGVAIAVTSIVMGLSMKALSKIGIGDILKGGIAIVAIATTIALSSWIISKGVYTGAYPNLNWILGVGISIVGFGVVMFLLGKLGVDNIIKGGVAIIAIAATIMLSSLIIGLGTYGKYPDLKWTLGVGVSIAAFGLIAFGLGFVAFSPTFWVGLGSIMAVAGTIVATSYIVNSGTYQKYPSLKWALGVGASIVGFGLAATGLGLLAFSPTFWLGIGVILSVAGTIWLVDKVFSKGDFKKFPSLSWVGGVGKIMGAMGLIAVGFALVSPLIIAGSISLLAIAGTIWAIDKVFSKGDFKKFPSKNWVDGSFSVIKSFGKLAIDTDGFGLVQLTRGMLKVVGIAGSVLEIEKTINKGSYSKNISKAWIDGTSSSIKSIGNLAIFADQFGILELPRGLGKLELISNAVNKISSSLSSGVYGKFPSKLWADGVFESLTSFSKLNSMGSISFNSTLSKMCDVILSVDKKFQTGNFTKFPTQNWVIGVTSSFGKFKELINMLNGNIVDKISPLKSNTLTSAVSNITLLSQSFDKLAKSVDGFSSSIESIDSAKISAINSMTNNSVIMMSILDPDQFNAMINRLEQKSGIFNDLISQFVEQKKEQTSTGTSFVKVTNAKTTKSDSQELGEKIDRMTSVLVDISSVVGGKGALKNYLSSVKTDVQIGGVSIKR